MSETTQNLSAPVLVSALLDLVGFVPVTITHHEKDGNLTMAAALDLQSGVSYSQPDFLDGDRILAVMANGTKLIVDAERVLTWASARGAFSDAKCLGFVVDALAVAKSKAQ